MTINRNIGLDYLRSVAIIIVLANHCLFEFFFGAGKAEFAGHVASLSVSAVIAIEWLFVLSGYLIGTMMIRSFEKPGTWIQRARDFWLRRWFRTVPNYYLFVIVNLLLIHYGLSKGAFEYKYLFFSQNLATVELKPHFFGESWSLALDEWFYFVMPVLLGILGLFLPMGGKKSFILASLALILLPMLGRLMHTTPVDFFQWDDQIRRITIYHLDATGWGVLAAVMNKWYPDWWFAGVKKKLVVGVLCMAAGLFFVVSLVHTTFMTPFRFSAGNLLSITLMAGGTFLVIPWLTSLSAKGGALTWITARLSLYSYSIYLVHYPMLFLMKHWFGIGNATSIEATWLYVVIWLALVFVISGVIFNVFEKPVSDLRDRFTKHVDASPFSKTALSRPTSKS
jgi:peptidoglycan/LPS O-acetylase OafA/YrhL